MPNTPVSNRGRNTTQLVLRLDWDGENKRWLLIRTWTRHNGQTVTKTQPIASTAAIDEWAADMLALVIRDEMLAWLF